MLLSKATYNLYICHKKETITVDKVEKGVVLFEVEVKSEQVSLESFE